MLVRILNKILRYVGYQIVPKISETPLKLNDIEEYPYSKAPFAGKALKKMCEDFEFQTVLDIGSGAGTHSEIFLEKGKRVTSLDFGTSIYYKQKSPSHSCIECDYLDYNFNHQFDAIWASHVLEHQPNPNIFLKKIYNDLKENGVLAITVPPLKHSIVGGHLTLWNAGLLLYQLVFAGFDCRNASILKYGYNISVLVKKKTIHEFPTLTYDKGDIDLLKDYFPENLGEPFDGNILNLNWE